MPKPKNKPAVVLEPNTSNWRQFITAGIILTLVSASLFIYIEYKNSKKSEAYNVLLKTGLEVEAVVTQRLLEEGDPQKWRLTFSYVIGSKTFTSNQEVSQKFFVNTQVGEQVKVLALPEDPWQSSIVALLNPPEKTWGHYVLLVLFLIGPIYIKKGNSVRLEAMRLDSEGKTVLGKLIERWEETGSDDTAYFVSFEFEVEQREGRRTLRLCSVNKAAYDAFSKNAPIKVCYLENRPEVCRLEL